MVELQDNIFLAIVERNIETVGNILKSDPESANATDQYGNTPLHWAIISEQTDMIRLLLKHGADVNIKDGNGNSPMDTAIEKGNGSIMDLLKNSVTGIDTVEPEKPVVSKVGESAEPIPSSSDMSSLDKVANYCRFIVGRMKDRIKEDPDDTRAMAVMGRLMDVIAYIDMVKRGEI